MLDRFGPVLAGIASCFRLGFTTLGFGMTPRLLGPAFVGLSPAGPLVLGYLLLSWASLAFSRATRSSSIRSSCGNRSSSCFPSLPSFRILFCLISPVSTLAFRRFFPLRGLDVLGRAGGIAARCQSGKSPGNCPCHAGDL